MKPTNRTKLHDNPAMIGTDGVQLSRDVAKMYGLSDDEYFKRPEPIRNLASLMFTLLVDEKLTDLEAANIADVPCCVATRCRAAIQA